MKKINVNTIRLAIGKSYTCTKCGRNFPDASSRPYPKGGICTFILHS